MSRKHPLHFPPRDAAHQPEPETDSLSEYRGTVVELPWPDPHGRRVLLAIDWHGHIFDQMAVIDAETQRVTDRMMASLEAIREQQQGPRLLSDDGVRSLHANRETPEAS